jgi:RNA polymerase sigma-70 factor (ECF subfamily)
MNEAHFRLFYETEAPGLRAYLLRLSNDDTLADDFLQESFIRLLKAAGGVQEEKRKSYLYTIATRLVYDHWRRLKIRRKWTEEASGDEPAAGDTGSLRYDMETAFRQLSPQQRSLLWLAYVEECEHREIAEALGVGEKSVKVLLYRAKKKILTILESLGFESKDSV